ncbi:MAG: hypothetical protein SFY80_16770 [Verrucomicrobiota bacterium]|nr:hypothetical protein [Verrucomicrobiota bacterium]
MWPFTDKDLDSLIYDYAEKKRPGDMRKLLKLLACAELFAPVISGLPDNPVGMKYIVGAGDRIQIRTVEVSGLKLVLFYTSKTDARLGTSFISMTGREAFEMVIKAEEGGIAVQNARTSWFGLDRQGVLDAIKEA